MTQEKKVQTAMVMDVRPFEQAARDAVQTMARAADDISEQGRRAGKGLKDGIEEGGKQSERSVDAATKSISDRIRRLTKDAQRELSALAASSAGGAGSAAALEYEAVLKGGDPAKLQPQIAAYRELKATVDSLKESMRQSAAGDEFLASIQARTQALQRQSQSLKMTEADMLALKAAERGVAQQAEPFISKLREAEAAADAAALASRRKAEADRFVAGVMAQANAIGKSRADLIEMQAALNGTTKELAPYIAAIRRADGEMTGMGRSAKEMQWAMRGLPAQFTDIWVSLASGQSPMTVFIQQGGQLKDMFGGIGPAARAMGGYFIGLVNPFTVAAAAAGVLFAAFQSGSNEITKLNQAVILSGQKLGVTAGQLQDIAAAVAATGAGTQGAASEFLAMIAKDAKVSAEELGRFAQAALAMARVGGPAAEETAKAFSELGKDPLQASIKLTGQYNYLTKATFEQIKALEEQGRTTEAATVAQRAFADFLQKRTPEMTEALGSIERGWISIKSAIAGAWDALKNIGRASTTSAQYESVNKQIEALQSGLGNFRGDAERRKQIEDEIERQRQRSNELRKQLELEQAGAIASKQRAEVNEALVRLSKFDAEYADKAKKAKKEIADFERDALKAGKDRAYIEDGIAKIREKYADKKSGSAADPFAADRDAARQWAQFYKEFADAADKAEGRVGALTDGQVKLLQLLNSPAYQKASDAQRQDVLTQAYRQIAAEQANEALKEQAKVSREAAREYESWLKEQSRGAEQADKQAQALRNEAEAQALVIPGYRSLETAIVMVEIARLRERQTAMLGNEDAVLAIQREIDARMKLVEMMTQRDVRKASEDQAKKAAAEWERTATSIRDSLTDALLRGFESGKDFARNFRDTLVNMFRTLVLRPIIQAVVNPVAMAITGGLGIGGTASAATNIVAQQGGSSVAQSLQNLYRTLTGSFDAVGNNVAAAASKLGKWLSTSTSETISQAGGTLMQYAGQIGAGAQVVAGAAAGMGLRRAVGRGYEISSGYSTFQDIGVAVATAIGGPVLGAIAGITTGLVNRAFGRAPKAVSESGIEGTFMAGDATGESFQNWVKKGGWFRSNKYGTDRTALDAELSAALDAGGLAVLRQTEAWAKALQLPAEYLTQVTTSFRVKLTGDAEKDKAAIAQVIQDYGVSLASIYEDVLQPLQREGENLADTLGRVSMLESFSRNLNALGGVFSRVANLGIDVRESFIAMAGGMDELMANALGFAQNYYSREEIAGLRANEILQALMAAGIGAAGDIGGSESRQEFRRLVESVDVSTETGRQQLATLLSVQGAFTDVADYLAETGATLAQAATQAPDAGPLTSLISPLQQQTDATNSLTGGMTNLRTSIERLIETMRQQVAAAMPAAAPAPAFAGWPTEVIDYTNPGGA